MLVNPIGSAGRSADVPANGFERKQGVGPFPSDEMGAGLSALVWYAFATTFLRLPANSVKPAFGWKTAKCRLLATHAAPDSDRAA